MAKAQKKKERDVNKHRREVDWQVGDKVYVKTKNWATERPKHKLDNQMAGPFDVIAQKGHSFQVQLPATLKRMHNTFTTDRLRKDPNNPLPGQINEEQGPIIIADEPEWEVEEIIASKKSPKEAILQS